MIWELATEEKSNLIVCASHGRKGPKADETVCGTLVEYVALS